MKLLAFSEKKRAICEPRWVVFREGDHRPDPCSGCPLSRPCVWHASHGKPGVDAYNAWVRDVNALAEEISGGVK